MSKSRPPPLPQHSASIPSHPHPSISSSPTPPANTLYKQKYPIASSASLASSATSTPSSSPTPSPPALPSSSPTTSAAAATSSSPFPSRPSSFSAGSPGLSLVNHSSVERPTPPYLSQRNSFVFEGDSMDGSYSYVISAPPSNAPSPTLTPHHSQSSTAQLPHVLSELSIHTNQPSQPPSASASSPPRFVPPPVPAHMRSSAAAASSSSNHHPESPSPHTAPVASVDARRGSNSATSSSLASSSSNSSTSSSLSHTLSQQDDAKTVEFYLKQAINAKDTAAIHSLLEKANKLHVDTQLIHTAQTVLAEKRTESINTFLFYLRQGVESRNREQLKMSIEKLTPLMAEGDVGAEVGQLVDRGRKLLGELDKESAQTVHFYLKQGIQLRNRDVIKQSLEKTPSIPSELLDKELTSAAQVLLTELDAQHLIKFYLQTAIKQKDDMALETALEQAKKLRMGGDVAEVSEGSRLLVELRTKGKGKSGSKKWKSSRLNGDKKGSKSAEKFQLFGGPLIEAIRRSDRPIPRLCYQCMDFLRATGLDEPGLFRVAGNKDAIDAIRHEYEEGDGSEVKLEEVHDVAGVFKLYLRMLPEPLIPYSRYDAFIRVGALKDKSKESQRNADLHEQVNQLPTHNYALLCSLVRFLVEVAAHSSTNKMTPENLAIVFAPNLIRPAEETPNTMLYDMPIAINIIASFILHVDEIFTQEPQTAVLQPSNSVSAAGGAHMAASSTASGGGGGHVSHSSMSMSMSSTLPGPLTVSGGRKVPVQNNTL